MSNKKVDIAKIKHTAEELYDTGGFYCSEAIVAAFKEHLYPEMPQELIQAASGFPVGVGRSKCMCGAVSGGVMTCGYVFGRTEGSDRKRSEKTLAVSKEVQERFRARNKVTCCSALTRGMEMGSPVHKAQCVRFTGEVAADVAEIIAREYALDLVEDPANE